MECRRAGVGKPLAGERLHSTEHIMAETVEAIQAHLQGATYILWPGSPDDPPKFIYDMDIWYMQPRKFKVANPLGPIFEYKRNTALMRWELQIATDTGTDRSTTSS